MKISADKSSASPTLDKSIMNNPADQTSLSDLLSINFFSKLISDTDAESSETESRELDDAQESSQLNPESNQLAQQDAESMLQVIQTMSAQMVKENISPDQDTSQLPQNNTSDLDVDLKQTSSPVMQPSVPNSTFSDAQSKKTETIRMNDKNNVNDIDNNTILSKEKTVVDNFFDNKQNIDKYIKNKKINDDSLEKIDLMKERQDLNLKELSNIDADKIASSLNQPEVSNQFKLSSPEKNHISNNNVLESMEKFSQLVSAKINPNLANLPVGQEHLLTSGISNSHQTLTAPNVSSNQPIISASEMTFHVEEQHMSSQAVGMATYQANIKIYPPELGQINASLKINNNRAILEITTENAQTKEILNTHLNDLRQQFSQANLQLDSIQINIGQPPTNTKNSDHNQSDTRDNQRDPQQAQNPVQMTLQSAEINRKRLNALVDAYI